MTDEVAHDYGARTEQTGSCFHQTTRTNKVTGEKRCVQCDELLSAGAPLNGRNTKQSTFEVS